jgi:hypothetical protein
VAHVELRKLESQATIRGCTVSEVIRLAIDEFANRRKADAG